MFSKARKVLAEIFVDVNNVSRNIDEDAGAIFLRVKETRKINYGNSAYIEYFFSYDLTVLVKENKFRVILKNVQNTDLDNYKTLKRAELIPVNTVYPAPTEKEGKKQFYLSIKKYF